ncbi:hypothetical protein LINPERPRIM_LOCUS39679 [Linum perenne]
MERALKPYDKECMRLAMLKHEETFKEQVYELHRLYRIQKLLMRNTDKPNRSRPPPNYSQNGFSFIPTTTTTTTNPDEKLELEESNGEKELIIDECEIELTLGPTSYGSKRARRKKVPETETPPLTSESAGPSSFSSSSTGSSQINRKNSNGRSSSITISNVDNGQMRLEQHDRLKQQQQQQQQQQSQPPWLFQVLSLNMT